MTLNAKKLLQKSFYGVRRKIWMKILEWAVDTTDRITTDVFWYGRRVLYPWSAHPTARDTLELTVDWTSRSCQWERTQFTLYLTFHISRKMSGIIFRDMTLKSLSICAAAVLKNIGYAHARFSPKSLMGICSDGPYECTGQIWSQ